MLSVHAGKSPRMPSLASTSAPLHCDATICRDTSKRSSCMIASSATTSRVRHPLPTITTSASRAKPSGCWRSTRTPFIDVTTKPWVVEAGGRVVEQPFHATGNVATAGGCLASHYLATWILARSLGREVAADILRYFTPVGQQADWATRAFAAIDPYL